VCGVEMARKLNAITKISSEALGYSFDYEEGVWNVIES